MEEVTKRYAVVTGANKGIGFGICRQLASNGITVVLTARDENRGQEAVEKLKQSGYHNVIFHLLDVADAASIDSLADFIKRKFGKLDILVNNAAISGVIVDVDALSRFVKDGEPIKWNEISTETYELVSKCIETNYYGAKRMCEALIPLLQLSNAPRIVNVSSSAGKLRNYPTNEWAVGVLSDVENLKEEKIEEVLNKYANDFKEGSPETKGWPASLSAYVMSKAALNAYTRMLARKYPNFLINCVCPGYVKTDMTFNNGPLTIEDGAEGPVWLALLPTDGPSGRFFYRKAETSFV